jgi:hypothetical protein
MSTTKTRLAGAVLLSIAAHVLLIGAVLTWLARPPVYPLAADETPLIVRLVPPPRRVTSPDARPASRSATRVLARPWTQSDAAGPIRAATSAAGENVGTPTGAEATDGEATPERVRQALRSGPVGCANADAVGLNRQERTHCNDILGKNMAQIQRAMREAEQGRLSTGGKPPTDFEKFKAAEARLKAAAGNRDCATGCAGDD